jgi:hypothetical protein
MAFKKQPVTFSVNIEVWQRCQKLKDKVPFTWSDVVGEALLKVLEPLEKVFNDSDNGRLPDEILNNLSDLNRTHYLDTESMISEHLVSKPKSKSLKTTKK